jgi:hypothetical protein
MLGWKRIPKTHPWDHDQQLLRFNPQDSLTLGQAMEGIAILGGTGSGKTTSSGFQLSQAMLRRGFGGLVLTVKVDEVERWQRLCRLTGRSNDLVIFDEEHGQQFNFLRYQAERQSATGGLTQNLVDLLEEMIELSGRVTSLRASRGDEQFWSYARRELARNAIDLVLLATGSISVRHLLEVVRDAPRSRDMASSPDFLRQSLIGMLLERARASIRSEYERHDLEQVEEYFTKSFAGLAEKTRSVVESSLFGVLDQFTRGKLHRLFGQGTTVTPDDILAGKIVVLNMPIKQMMGIGMLGQSLFKAQFQQRLEQRSAKEDRPCFLYIDEAQGFLTARDMQFAATARSSQCVNVWLTQNISNVYVALGGDESGRAAADSLLGLANTKILHQNADAVTNEWAATLIGRRRLLLRSSSTSHGTFSTFFPRDSIPQMSFSRSEAIEFIVQPHQFASLRKGGMPHRFAEAIVFQGGRRWAASRDSFLRVHIEQGF